MHLRGVQLPGQKGPALEHETLYSLCYTIIVIARDDDRRCRFHLHSTQDIERVDDVLHNTLVRCLPVPLELLFVSLAGSAHSTGRRPISKSCFRRGRMHGLHACRL